MKKREVLRYRSNYHMQNATCYDAAPTSAWKNALMNTSALAVGMYYNTAYASKGSAVPPITRLHMQVLPL